MPNWFPWIFVGGILFILLGWIGTRYKERTYHRIQTLQDFISGAICIGFMGILIPDVFPSISGVTAWFSTGDAGLLSMYGDGVSLEEQIVQVGPPRLVRS